MIALEDKLATWCCATAALLRERVVHEVWTAAGRVPVTLAAGTIALFTDFTTEDRAAKGLRSFSGPAAAEARHYSALERVAQERCLLLLGEPGSGKSTFAMHLALDLAEAWLERRTLAGFDGALAPLYWPVEEPGDVVRFLGEGLPDGAAVHLIVDSIEREGEAGPAALAALGGFAARAPLSRVLVCGDLAACRDWSLPPDFVRDRLIALSPDQRTAWFDRLAMAHRDLAARRAQLGQLPDGGSPALLAMAFGLADWDGLNRAHDIVDRWLAAAPMARASAAPFVDLHRTARELAALAPDVLAGRVADEPFRLAAPAALAAQRMPEPQASQFAAALLRTGNGAAAVIAAAIDGGAAPAQLRALLAAVVEQGALPLSWRVQAGGHLARLGDPRDLDALVAVPAGPFEMGSQAHPNSAPPHPLSLPAYRIGRYPVTNAQYGAFVTATGRPWRSAEGPQPERANAPAVDLTWHDARAYCAWLSERWRNTGRIGHREIVRLPTEPEWEKAARGARPSDGDHVVYPWDGAWQPDRQNGEDAGLNATCTVGLFPAGVSPWGCLDMTGQVWEWTSTLWGTDMAAPSFRYPYRDDGREDAVADRRVRRVLRGGCFSSARFKASCTYRGSLEPDGFWRGNGFRIVVAHTGGGDAI